MISTGTAGRVTVTRDAAGRPFDWQLVTEGLLAIKSSPERPENAAVAVNYRNSWFYIDDSDLDSKSTFSLLGQIYQLQAGSAKRAGPEGVEGRMPGIISTSTPACCFQTGGL